MLTHSHRPWSILLAALSMLGMHMLDSCSKSVPIVTLFVAGNLRKGWFQWPLAYT